jgi:hypothetical protein
MLVVILLRISPRRDPLIAAISRCRSMGQDLLDDLECAFAGVQPYGTCSVLVLKLGVIAGSAVRLRRMNCAHDMGASLLVT